MFKVIIALVVVLVVFLWFVGSSTSVTGFFGAVKDRAGFVTGLIPDLSSTQSQEGDIEFMLALDEKPGADFELTESSIEIDGVTDIALVNGKFSLDGIVTSDAFTGRMKSGDSLSFDGSGSLSGEGIEFEKERFTLESQARTASITNAHAQKLSLDTSGEITFGSSLTTFSGSVEIRNFAGDIEVGERMVLSGTASRVIIPSAGIDKR